MDSFQLHCLSEFVSEKFKLRENSTMCFVCVCVCVDGEGNGTPLQYSCLENPMDRGAW